MRKQTTRPTRSEEQRKADRDQPRTAATNTRSTSEAKRENKGARSSPTGTSGRSKERPSPGAASTDTGSRKTKVPVRTGAPPARPRRRKAIDPDASTAGTVLARARWDKPARRTKEPAKKR